MMEPLDRVFVTLPGSVAIVEILGLFVGGDEPFELFESGLHLGEVPSSDEYSR